MELGSNSALRWRVGWRTGINGFKRNQLPSWKHRRQVPPKRSYLSTRLQNLKTHKSDPALSLTRQISHTAVGGKIWCRHLSVLYPQYGVTLCSHPQNYYCWSTCGQWPNNLGNRRKKLVRLRLHGRNSRETNFMFPSTQIGIHTSKR
jgi:hypothetical protein